MNASEARARLRALDRFFEAGATPPARLVLSAARSLAESGDPRLAELARLLVPGLDRRTLWCALVPVERSLAKVRVTDAEIIEGDRLDGPPAAPAMSAVAVLDSLRSAFNVGGAFRTAECFGFEALHLCGYTATPEQPAVARSALGTESLVPWTAYPDVCDSLRALRREGRQIVALETVKGAPDADAFPWRFPCALVLGNERFGISPDVLALCDGAVRIPLAGRKNSLNVVSAFAIAAHAIRSAFDRART